MFPLCFMYITQTFLRSILKLCIVFQQMSECQITTLSFQVHENKFEILSPLDKQMELVDIFPNRDGPCCKYCVLFRLTELE